MVDTDLVRKDLRIRATKTAVYDTLCDFSSYPEWISEIRRADVIREDSDGRADEVHFVMGAVGVSLGLTLSYRYSDTQVAWHLVKGDMLQRLDGAYDILDNGDGTTTLTYTLEIDSNLPVPGVFRRRVARKIVGDTLNAIRARAEAP